MHHLLNDDACEAFEEDICKHITMSITSVFVKSLPVKP